MSIHLIAALRFSVDRTELTEALIDVQDVAGAVSDINIVDGHLVVTKHNIMGTEVEALFELPYFSQADQLSSDIEAEATLRGDADALLLTRLNSEITTRAEADALLVGRVVTLESSSGGGGGGLTGAQVNTLINNSGHASQTDLSTEVTDRALGDEALGVRIDNIDPTIADDSIIEAKLAPEVRTKLNASGGTIVEGTSQTYSLYILNDSSETARSGTFPTSEIENYFPGFMNFTSNSDGSVGNPFVANKKTVAANDSGGHIFENIENVVDDSGIILASSVPISIQSSGGLNVSGLPLTPIYFAHIERQVFLNINGVETIVSNERSSKERVLNRKVFIPFDVLSYTFVPPSDLPFGGSRVKYILKLVTDNGVDIPQGTTFQFWLEPDTKEVVTQLKAITSGDKGDKGDKGDAGDDGDDGVDGQDGVDGAGDVSQEDFDALSAHVDDVSHADEKIKTIRDEITLTKDTLVTIQQGAGNVSTGAGYSKSGDPDDVIVSILANFGDFTGTEFNIKAGADPFASGYNTLKIKRSSNNTFSYFPLTKLSPTKYRTAFHLGHSGSITYDFDFVKANRSVTYFEGVLEEVILSGKFNVGNAKGIGVNLDPIVVDNADKILVATSSIAVITSGAIASGTNPLFGWSAAFSDPPSLRGGSLNIDNIPDNFVAIFSRDGRSEIHTKAGTTELSILEVGGVNYTLTKTATNVQGLWIPSLVDEYKTEISSDPLGFIQAGQIKKIAIKKADGSILLKSLVVEGTIPLSDARTLLGGLTDDSVTTVKIRDNAVTRAKLEPAIAEDLLALESAFEGDVFTPGLIGVETNSFSIKRFSPINFEVLENFGLSTSAKLVKDRDNNLFTISISVINLFEPPYGVQVRLLVNKYDLINMTNTPIVNTILDTIDLFNVSSHEFGFSFNVITNFIDNNENKTILLSIENYGFFWLRLSTNNIISSGSVDIPQFTQLSTKGFFIKSTDKVYITNEYRQTTPLQAWAIDFSTDVPSLEVIEGTSGQFPNDSRLVGNFFVNSAEEVFFQTSNRTDISNLNNIDLLSFYKIDLEAKSHSLYYKPPDLFPNKTGRFVKDNTSNNYFLADNETLKKYNTVSNAFVESYDMDGKIEGLDLNHVDTLYALIGRSGNSYPIYSINKTTGVKTLLQTITIAPNLISSLSLAIDLESSIDSVSLTIQKGALATESDRLGYINFYYTFYDDNSFFQKSIIFIFPFNLATGVLGTPFSKDSIATSDFSRGIQLSVKIDPANVIFINEGYGYRQELATLTSDFQTYTQIGSNSFPVLLAIDNDNLIALHDRDKRLVNINKITGDFTTIIDFNVTNQISQIISYPSVHKALINTDRLDELNDVRLVNLQDKDGLVYNEEESKWENKDLEVYTKDNIDLLPEHDIHKELIINAVERPIGLVPDKINKKFFMVGRNQAALHTVDLTTSIATRVGNVYRFGVDEAEPAALAELLGKTYMLGRTNNCLYELNTKSGHASRIGNVENFGIGEIAPEGLESINGKLYFVGATTHYLCEISHKTGQAQRIGNVAQFGFGERLPSGLTKLNGELLMVGASTDKLYKLNTDTGAATLYGSALSFGVGESTPSSIASNIVSRGGNKLEGTMTYRNGSYNSFEDDINPHNNLTISNGVFQLWYSFNRGTFSTDYLEVEWETALNDFLTAEKVRTIKSIKIVKISDGSETLFHFNAERPDNLATADLSNAVRYGVLSENGYLDLRNEIVEIYFYTSTDATGEPLVLAQRVEPLYLTGLHLGNLFSIAPSGQGTRVGSAVDFGVAENTPTGMTSFTPLIEGAYRTVKVSKIRIPQQHTEFRFVTQAEYDAIVTKEANIAYVIQKAAT